MFTNTFFQTFRKKNWYLGATLSKNAVPALLPATKTTISCNINVIETYVCRYNTFIVAENITKCKPNVPIYENVQPSSSKINNISQEMVMTPTRQSLHRSSLKRTEGLSNSTPKTRKLMVIISKKEDSDQIPKKM